MSTFFEPGVPPKAAAARPVFDWARMAAPTETKGWSAPEGFFAILFSAVTCDGELDRLEQEGLLALVHRSRALKAMTAEDLAALNTRVVAKLRESPAEALEAACKALPNEMRLPAFAQALDLILADGDLSQPEAAMLNALASHLDLPAQDVKRVAEIIILKNRV